MTQPARTLARLQTLNVGCGPQRSDQALGVDFDPSSAADVFCDLNSFPWPFADNRFGSVQLSHVLEHLQEPDRALREAHRVCRAGGVVRVVTPHYSSYQSYGDITHRWHFGRAAFDPFHKSDAAYSGAGRPIFRLKSCRLTFGSSPLCWPGRLISSISFLFYEKYFAFLFPGRNLELEFEVVK